jgi:threonine/homoserine/homoserine lactone efflux protein
MMGIHDYALFVLTGLLVNLTPGQDTMFILGQSLRNGRQRGEAAALGIAAGSVCHTFAAVLGLSALLAASAWAFNIVKIAGALYLIFLGLRMLLSAKHGSLEMEASADDVASKKHSSFTQGLLTNVMNPKVALFYLSLLPQFIDPLSTHKTLAFLLLGATFIVTGTIWGMTLAALAVPLQKLLRTKPGWQRRADRVFGTALTGVGVKVLLSSR